MNDAEDGVVEIVTTVSNEQEAVELARALVWLDLEVGVFGGTRRWSAIFLEDGLPHEASVHWDLTDTELQEDHLDPKMRQGYTRNTLDLAAIPVLKRLSHLPIIADPSHGTGRWHLVEPMALAAVAAGAHGLIIEVHPNPDKALSDGPQSLTFENFQKLMDGVRSIAEVVGKQVAPTLA